jgi:hypothetical protein
VELTSLVFGSGGHLFVCPGAMGDGTFEQSAVFELVRKDVFEEVEIRKCNLLFLQGRSTIKSRKRRQTQATALPAVK